MVKILLGYNYLNYGLNYIEFKNFLYLIYDGFPFLARLSKSTIILASPSALDSSISASLSSCLCSTSDSLSSADI